MLITTCTNLVYLETAAFALETHVYTKFIPLKTEIPLRRHRVSQGLKVADLLEPDMPRVSVATDFICHGCETLRCVD